MTDLIAAGPTTQPEKRGRGRPRRDWSVRSVLVMPLVPAFLGNLDLKTRRDLDIINRRLGMYGPSETLESIGSGYGLTREAMRQVVKRFAREVLGGAEGVELFLSACARATSDGPIPLAAIEGTDPLFAGLGSQLPILDAAFSLVEALSPGMHGTLPHVRDITGIPSLVPVPAKVWDEAVDDTTRILRLALPDASAIRAEAVLSHLPAETREVVVMVAQEEDTGETEHGDIQACVRLFLEDTPRPVSLKEIAARVAEVTGSEIKLQRVVNVANRVGVRVARGRYTIAERVGIAEAETNAIRHLTAEFLCAGDPKRQWHASEIVPLIAGRDGIRADLTPELLGFALKGASTIHSLGRMVYGLAEASAGTRIHLRDLIIAAIEEAGRPMTKQEIKEAVTLVRGVGTGFNVTEGNGIVRLPGGTFVTEAMSARFQGVVSIVGSMAA